ncbi:MAG: type III pantothenate kinase [Clostridia bacterium]
MLLVIDVGNTNIKLGLYDNDSLRNSWRMSVKVTRTADEFAITMESLFNTRNITFKDIDGIIMSSVSPDMNYTIEHACEYYIGLTPMVVGPGIKTGVNVQYTNPQELGADRIVNSVASYKLYGGPCIIVDFGTATTFNMISIKGDFMGGVIAPGIKSSVEAFTTNTAKLPTIELVKPAKIINKSTVGNMQAGIIYGFTGMVDYIIQKMKEESGYENVKVIATGGLSNLIATEKDGIFDIIDRFLTLKGLKIIYDMNKKE